MLKVISRNEEKGTAQVVKHTTDKRGKRRSRTFHARIDEKTGRPRYKGKLLKVD